MITYSAPSKVLLTGGYSILYPDNFGVVFSISPRSYCSCRFTPLPTSHLRVSCHFLQANQSWSFDIDHSSISAPFAFSNPYVQRAVEHSLLYLSSLNAPISSLRGNLELFTYLESPFHLHSPSSSSFPSIYHNTPKTGIGSSASIIVSIFYSMTHCLSNYLEIPFNLSTERAFSFCLKAHQCAQNGLGSGFDVYSVIFGSCMFSRNFSKCKPLSLPNKWNFYLLKPFKIGESLACSTVRSSRAVLKAIAESSDLNELFLKYCDLCNSFADKLRRDPDDNSIFLLSSQIRSLIIEFSKKSGIDIVPFEISQLFDLIDELNNPNLISYSFSGAGGWDCIWFLVKADFDFKHFIKDLSKLVTDREINCGVEIIENLGINDNCGVLKVSDFNPLIN
ncbi:hypothetical protein P9112_003178 [Eukaryota sp. TZLM1-RC]